MRADLHKLLGILLHRILIAEWTPGYLDIYFIPWVTIL
jgi:hypothetical protein